MKKGLSKSVSFTFFYIPQPPLKTRVFKAFSFFIPFIHAPTTVTNYLLIKMLPIYNLLITFTKPFFKI